MAMTERDRRALLIFGIFALTAVLVWFFLLRGGGEQGEVTQPPTGTTSVEPTGTPRTTPPPDDGVAVIGQRDPFDPLIVVPTDGGGGGPTGSPTNGGNGNGSGSPQPTDSPSVSPPPDGGPGPGDGSSITIGGHTVVLLDIFTRDGEQVAQVEVDGTVYVVAEGETFDDNFQLISISGNCATFRFGDERFTLCAQAPK
jgi:hypothetical protein